MTITTTSTKIIVDDDYSNDGYADDYYFHYGCSDDAGMSLSPNST